MSHRKVGAVMSTGVVTVRPDTPFKEVVRVLEQRDVGAAPVVDDTGRVLGVVSQADLLVKQGEQEPAWSRSPVARLRRRHDARHHARRAGATTAGALMTEPAITVGPGTSVVRAARMLSRHNIKRLPVVDAEGRLAGIVSRKDLLAVFLRKDEDIRDDIIENVFEFGLGLPVSSATVRVSVHDGMVSLDGQVELKSQVPLVEQMARHIDGVVDVEMSMSYVRDDTGARPQPRPGAGITREPGWS